MSANNNPYAPPQANVDVAPSASDAGFIENGRSRPISDGVVWISQAITMFLSPSWWKWVIVMLLFLALTACIAAIPVLNIANVFIGPILSAGIAYSADIQRRTGDFAIGDAFKGFSEIGQLLLVGLAVFLMAIVMSVSMVVWLGVEGVNALAGAVNDPFALLRMVWRGLLLAFVLWIPIIAAVSFAPALIMLHGFSAFRAMKSSFLGAFKNILAGILCVVVLFVSFVIFVMIAAIALSFLDSRVSGAVSMVLFAPVATLLSYTIYRRIFFSEDT